MTSGKAQRLLLCRLGEQRLALPIAIVERVWPAMAMTPLNDAAAGVSGAVSLQGERIPVLDMRRRLGCAAHDITPDDVFVLAQRGGRRAGFFVDAVDDVVDAPPDGSLLIADLDALFAEGVQ